MNKQVIDELENEGVLDKNMANRLREIQNECGNNPIKAKLMLVMSQLENLINRDSPEFKVQIQSRIELVNVLISKLPNQVSE